MAGLLLLIVIAAVVASNTIPPPFLVSNHTFPSLAPYHFGGVLERFHLTARGKVSIQHRDPDFTIEPKDLNFTIQPKDSAFTIDPRGANFIIEPRDTVELMSRPHRYQPRARGKVFIQPSDPTITIYPRGPDFSIEPKDTVIIKSRPLRSQPRAAIELKCKKKPQVAKVKHGDIVTFYSKNYPEKYAKKSMCNWKIMGQTETTRISIDCAQDFKLQPKSKKGKCGDYLDIDGYRYCGREIPVYSSNTNIVKMKFKSNKKKQFPGFICTAVAYDDNVPTTVAPTVAPTVEPTVAPTCSCGRVNRATRIVGGVETEVNEYPWHVALVWSLSWTSSFCGGSIINEWWILTASHCADVMSTNNVVVAGEHSWSTDSSVAQRVDIEQILMHPKYNNYMENDVALIKLATPLLLDAGNLVAPICPPRPTDLYENVVAIVTGWGTLSAGGSAPDSLQEVVVPTMSNSECKSAYGSYITDDMICAGYSKGGKDACQGDSGGPLITADGSFYRLIGVVSWGYGCADPDYPGVYARVNNQLEWITTSISGTSWCEPGTVVTSGPVNTTPKPVVTTAVPVLTEASTECKCGHVNRQTRIVNGNETEVLEYPWQAGIVSYGGSRTWCGGSLLNSKWVLTAAHCTDGTSPSAIQILLGEHTIYTTDGTEQRFDVSKVINHPSYTDYPWTNGHDISLLELSREVDFSSTLIRPICLPSTQDLFEGVQATVTGFGRTGHYDNQSLVLMEVDIPVWSNIMCIMAFGNDNIDDTMICAGTGDGTGPCMGDSGGPLITSVGDYHVQIGVVSYGSSYCGSLAAFARVTALQSWVEGYAMTGNAIVCTP